MTPTPTATPTPVVDPLVAKIIVAVIDDHIAGDPPFDPAAVTHDIVAELAAENYTIGCALGDERHVCHQCCPQCGGGA